MEEMTTIGVPESAPVDVSMDRPDGRAGVIDQESTAPPLAVGVAVVMADPLVRVKGVPV